MRLTRVSQNSLPPAWRWFGDQSWLPLTLYAAGVYLLLGLPAFSLAVSPGTSCPFWPAAGWAFLAILLAGKRAVAGLIIGAFFVNASGPVWYGMGFVSAVFVGGVRAVGSIVAAAIAVRFLNGVPRSRTFFQPKSLSRFALYVVLSALVSGSIGVTAGACADSSQFKQFWQLAIIWILGDTIGMLVVVPLGLRLLDASGGLQREAHWRWVFILLWAGACVAILYWYPTVHGLAIVGLGVAASFCFFSVPLCHAMTLGVCVSVILLTATGHGYLAQLDILRTDAQAWPSRDLALALFLLGLTSISLLTGAAFTHLRAGRLLFDQAVEFVPVAVIWVNAEGDLVRANPDARIMLGVDSSHARGSRDWTAALATSGSGESAWPEGWEAYIRARRADQAATPFDATLRVRDGGDKGRVVRFVAKPLPDADGELAGFIAVLRPHDTDGEALRDQLARILHDATHELSFLKKEHKRLARKLAPGSDADYTGAVIALDILEDLIEWSGHAIRRSAPGVSQYRLIRPKDVIREEAYRLGFRARESVETQIDLRHGTPPLFLADDTTFQFVVRVLLHNAVKHGRQPVDITIVQTREANRPRLQFTFQDRGDGMTQARFDEVRRWLKENDLRDRARGDAGDPRAGKQMALVVANRRLQSLGSELRLEEDLDCRRNLFKFELPYSPPQPTDALLVVVAGSDDEAAQEIMKACEDRELRVVRVTAGTPPNLQSHNVRRVFLVGIAPAGFANWVTDFQVNQRRQPDARRHWRELVMIETADDPRQLAAEFAKLEYIEIPRKHIEMAVIRVSRDKPIPDWLGNRFDPPPDTALGDFGPALAVDDDPRSLGLLLDRMVAAGLTDVRGVVCAEEADAVLSDCKFRVVLLDRRLGGSRTGDDLAAHIQDKYSGNGRPIVLAVSGDPYLSGGTSFDGSLPKDFLPRQLRELLIEIAATISSLPTLPTEAIAATVSAANCNQTLMNVNYREVGLITQTTLRNLVERFSHGEFLFRLAVEDPDLVDIGLLAHGLLRNAEKIQCAPLVRLLERIEAQGWVSQKDVSQYSQLVEQCIKAVCDRIRFQMVNHETEGAVRGG